MRGVAAGAELEPWQLGMLNARTEILAAAGATGEGECSTAVYLPTGAAPRTVQTWDWHDELDADNLVVRYDAAAGHSVRYFTEFGMLGKIGRNGAGLGVHFNILNHASDDDRTGACRRAGDPVMPRPRCPRRWRSLRGQRSRRPRCSRS